MKDEPVVRVWKYVRPFAWALVFEFLSLWIRAMTGGIFPVSCCRCRALRLPASELALCRLSDASIQNVLARTTTRWVWTAAPPHDSLPTAVT